MRFKRKRKNRRRFSPQFESLESKQLMTTVLTPYNGGEFPFEHATADHMGTSIERANLYDLQPSIMYDESAPSSQRFKMWWLGQDSALPPTPNDRIYYAYSADGDNWSTPQIVLAPQHGASGVNWADDHLLGSPSVLKVDNLYYMYYETYAMAATPIQSFYSFTIGDSWATNGSPALVPADGYNHFGALGIAPLYEKAGTRPIYAGQATYAGGKRDRYWSLDPVTTKTENGHLFQPLSNTPILYLYDSPAAGRKPIYQFFDLTHSNSFVTDSPTGNGIPNIAPAPGLIGYAAEDIDSPDMIGNHQNRIMMATSMDGINWNRIRGNARDGAIVEPRNPLVTQFDISTGLSPSGSYDLEYRYGSGYPVAIVRDDRLELYFSDDSEAVGLENWKIDIDVNQIANPNAYSNADHPTAGNREWAFPGTDMAWSPFFDRYFATSFRLEPVHKNTPTLVWSNVTHSTDDAHDSIWPWDPTLAFGHQFAEPIPTSNDGSARLGSRGGLIRNHLGHTLDFPDHANPHTAFHIYYESAPASLLDDGYQHTDNFSLDLNHALVFAYHLPDVSISNASLWENNTNATFTVELTKASSQTIEIDYATANGTAIAGEDYEAKNGTLVFLPGQTSKTINVPIFEDDIEEINETFFVNLSTDSGAELTSNQATGAIRNDDHVTISVQDVSVVEGDSGNANTALFQVRRTDLHASQTVSVNYATVAGSATANVDFTPVSGVITFGQNEFVRTIPVSILGDTTLEPDEDFELVLSNPSFATLDPNANRATATIQNDDVPSLSIQATASVHEGDSGSTPAEFVVTLSHPSDQLVTVDYATRGDLGTPGVDFETTNGRLTFQPNVTQQSIHVPIIGDVIDEWNDTYWVDLSNPVNATIDRAQGRGIIVDQDPAPSMAINDVSVVEGDNGNRIATFSVTLSSVSAKTITVDYATANGTATSGSDFDAANGQLEFTPGETSKQVNVNVLGDTAGEGNEAFQVILSNQLQVVMADNIGVGTIVDDDGTSNNLVANDIFVAGSDWAVAPYSIVNRDVMAPLPFVNLNQIKVEFAGATPTVSDLALNGPTGAIATTLSDVSDSIATYEVVAPLGTGSYDLIFGESAPFSFEILLGNTSATNAEDANTVGIFDIIAVAVDFGKTSTQPMLPDTDGDGLVGIPDLIAVAVAFGTILDSPAAAVAADRFELMDREDDFPVRRDVDEIFESHADDLTFV